MVATMHNFYLMILLFSAYLYCRASVCDTQKKGIDEQSFIVQIWYNEIMYFCPGVLVKLDWVLTSYSCFMELKDLVELDDRKGNQPYKSFQYGEKELLPWENPHCFNISNENIWVKSSASKCINKNLEKNSVVQTTPQFGVVNDNYNTLVIPWQDRENTTSNGQYDDEYNVVFSEREDFHVNDLLLLKLQDKLYDDELRLIPLHSMKNNTQNANTYEIYYHSRPENMSMLNLKAKVFSESENDDFKCPEPFNPTLCTHDLKFCSQQIYYCGRFSLQDSEYRSYLRSGDPLVLGKDSEKKQILGFFNTDLIPLQQLKKFDFYSEDPFTIGSYKPGNYSYEENSAIFAGFSEENIDWIQVKIDQYSGKNSCIFETINKNTVQYNNNNNNNNNTNIIIVVSSIFGIIFIVFVVIVVYSIARKTNSNKIQQPLLNSNLEAMQDQELQEMGEQNFVQENENIEVQMVQNTGLQSYGQMASAIQETRQGDDSNLNMADMVGLQENLNMADMVGLQEKFSKSDENRYGPFSYLHNWLSEIKLPQGVRDIPINDLKFIKYLGAGGFAVVYEAEFAENTKEKYKDINEKKLAVKVIFQEYFQIKEQMEAILKEVAAMSKLQSQYIVKLIGASLVIHPSIVMELVSGGSLEDLLNTEDQTSSEWKLKLFLNISRGIQYLHSKRILHRDLKPANILVQNPHTPIIKISDFGLAKIKHTSQALGNTKNGAGTKHYMAPEMYDESASIDEKVDIWALAVIMQQVLRGIKPWKDQLEPYIICRISVHKEPPDNGILPLHCPQDLRQLIVDCWKASYQRPTADEIVQQLEVMLQREST